MLLNEEITNIFFFFRLAVENSKEKIKIA